MTCKSNCKNFFSCQKAHQDRNSIEEYSAEKLDCFEPYDFEERDEKTRQRATMLDSQIAVEGDFISRNDLLELIKDSRPLNWTDTDEELTEQRDFDEFETIVKSITAAKVHKDVLGHYIPCQNNSGYKCSICGARIKNAAYVTGNHFWCYKCGAKMK